MGKRPRRNDATRPGRASSAWNVAGWYHVYHKPSEDWQPEEYGLPKSPTPRRQGRFPRPLLGLHYHRPPRPKSERNEQLIEMRKRQKVLALALGVIKEPDRTMSYAQKEANKLARNTAEFAEIKAQVEDGDISPVRRRQLRDGFLEAGLDHLLG